MPLSNPPPAGVDGSGSANRLPRFSGASTLADSNIVHALGADEVSMSPAGTGIINLLLHGAGTGVLRLGANGAVQYHIGTTEFRPMADASAAFGAAAQRWTDVFAAQYTVQAANGGFCRLDVLEELLTLSTTGASTTTTAQIPADSLILPVCVRVTAAVTGTGVARLSVTDPTTHS